MAPDPRNFRVYFEGLEGGALEDASKIGYTGDDLDATNVDAAIDELGASVGTIDSAVSGKVDKSTLTTNGDILTRSGGAPARITRADLAADAAFASKYQPIVGDRHFVTAGCFGIVEGSPTIEAFGGGWLLDAAANEGVTASVMLPSWWATYDVYFHWYNAGAGSGNVLFAYYYQAVAAGETMAPYGGASGQLVASSALDVLKITKMTASPIAAGDPLISMMAYRSASDGSDTLANDIGLVGVEYRMVT